MNKLYKVLQNINNEIINALSDNPNSDEKDSTQTKLKDYTLDNGDVISVEGELEVGAIVTDSEGNAYADGEYHLEDGSLVRIENGIVTEYVPEEDSEEDSDESSEQSKDEKPTDAAANTTVQKKVTSTTKMDTNKTKDNDSKTLTIDLELGTQAKQLVSLTKSITDLQTQLAELKTKLESQNKVNSDLLKQIETIGNQPSTKPLTIKDSKVDETKLTLAQRLARK